MSECLEVEGVGATRALALEHADSQAKTYFENTAFEREVGRAEVAGQSMIGKVEGFRIRVKYRP